MPEIPELLYHTTLVVYDGSRDPSNRSRSASVLGTHTTLAAARAFSAKALQGLGYQTSDFSQYDVHDGVAPEDWTHGDGVVVYAKAPAGQEFAVGLHTTPNDQEFASGVPSGTLRLSGSGGGGSSGNHGKDDNDSAPQLHYVLQTEVDYDQVNSSFSSADFKTTEIEGCFLRCADAIAATKRCLRNTGEEFAQYDERDNLDFAEDVHFFPILPGTHKPTPTPLISKSIC